MQVTTLKKQLLLLSLSLISLIVLAMAPHLTWGDGYHTEVNPLQAVVDQAAANQVLIVPPGTYRGTLIINKPLTLMALSRDSTILEGTSDWDEITLNASNIRISGLTIRNYWLGIHAGAWYRPLSNIVIDACAFRNITTPIGFFNITSATISNNQFARDTQAGSRIEIQWSQNVTIENNNFINTYMYLDDFNRYFLIKGNNITGPQRYGLIIQGSWNNTITQNTFANNEIGILDIYSLNGNNPMPNKSFNLIYRNNFMYNSLQVGLYYDPNGFCNVTDLWDNRTIGNYWSDYNGVDQNADGIGDTPYVISQNNIDRFPLMTDPAPERFPDLRDTKISNEPRIRWLGDYFP